MNTHPPLKTSEENTVLGASTLHLERFRNFDEMSVQLHSGFNILAGQNAQGKTNFLESLYLLATSRLLRGQRDAEAIQEGYARATVSATTWSTDTELTIILERSVRKRAQLNGVSLPRAADLIGRLPCVCVSAADMEIVRGDPSERRLFLDLELSALSPSYLRHLAGYKRALEQRNALLKDSRESFQPAIVFEPWEQQLAQHGSALRQRRQEFVELLAPETRALHSALSKGETIELAYVSRDEACDADALSELLENSRHVDAARGGTSVGPHRDDLAIIVGGREARLYGSQGQQRTSVIAMKLATMRVACVELGSPPLLLLDDILSDLDEGRRKNLVDIVLESAGQALLTCTEVEAAGKRILEAARVFHVSDGRVRAA